MTTYNKILKILEMFAIHHLGVKRFMAGPIDEMSDMTSKNENFPVLYVTPLDAFISDLNEQIEIRIYCYDRRTKDKLNYNPNLSDCLEILRDLDTWLRNTYDIQHIEVNNTSTIYPFENELMDDVDGWYMNITLDVDSRTLCDIPFNIPIEPYYGCEPFIEPEPPYPFFIEKEEYSEGPYSLGDTIRFFLYIRNNGDQIIHNININDPLTGFEQFLSFNSPLDNLVYTTSYIVTQEDINNGQIINTVYMTADEVEDSESTVIINNLI